MNHEHRKTFDYFQDSIGIAMWHEDSAKLMETLLEISNYMYEHDISGWSLDLKKLCIMVDDDEN